MGTMTIDGRKVEFTDEKNVLTVIRNAGINIPTLCYHSEVSTFGACRLCTVEDDRGKTFASCSEQPRDGMVIYTNSGRIKKYRKLIVELLLAAHCRDCTTCVKSGECILQELAHRLGVRDIRFENTREQHEIDDSSPSIIRDPNKCILCGNCVRACEELQGIGALGFAFRGTEAMVMPAFNKKIAETQCVNCGQCRVYCPTGAISIRTHMDEVWDALADKDTRVVAQIAPAVRVAVGDHYGLTKGRSAEIPPAKEAAEDDKRPVVLECDKVTYKYSIGTPFEKTAVNSVDLKIRQGEFVGIIGHTGSGKSTLIQHFDGLVKPTSGRVLVDGADIWSKDVNIRSIRFKVGLVFQYSEHQLFEETVAKDIAYGPKNMGLSEEEINKRVRSAAESMDIVHLLDRSPFELSGGQQRRAALAGVLAMDPEVLILDEPAAGMNPHETEDLMDIVRRIRDEFDMTILLIEHDMKFVSGLCDEITVLNFGTVLAQGKTEDALSDPEVIKAYIGE